jgi:hypothetical protein
MNIIQAIYKLYPTVIRTEGDIAYDADGDEVEYDIEAVNAKVVEMQAEKEAKLAKLGLTPDDLKALLG